MKTVIINTPLEVYPCGKAHVRVKREDCCVEEGGPPFSKVRGLYQRMLQIQRRGDVAGVAYVETAVSMAGWGVAWVARVLGMKCVIFDPQYVNSSDASGADIHRLHRIQWRANGADIRPIPAGRAKVAWYAAREPARAAGLELLPLGLPFEETIEETAREFHRTLALGVRPKTVVVCVGSGTVAAGILRAMPDGCELIGVMSRQGNAAMKEQAIRVRAETEMCVGLGSLFPPRPIRFHVVDGGYQYTERARRPLPPFPSHEYYDAKAWEWLTAHVSELESPIWFWNIGRGISPARSV